MVAVSRKYPPVQVAVGQGKHGCHRSAQYAASKMVQGHTMYSLYALVQVIFLLAVL